MTSAIELAVPVRMLLVGPERLEFREAARLAEREGAAVRFVSSGGEALEALREEGADLALVDVASDVPGLIGSLRAERMALPVLACGVDCPADRAVAAIRAGAQDYLPLPPQADLIAAAILSVGVRALSLVGQAPAFRQATGFALAMARTAAPILIRGEPGSGKELLARAIHQTSGRPGRFVSVNGAEAAADLVEAELFGQEAGAFEGAVARRRGRIEEASGGTLYLREVGLLSPAAQTRLLTVVEQRRLRRLGGQEDVRADVRIISGTSLDLAPRAAEGRFLPDLLARLGAVQIAVPPLRERGHDIAAIARHFATRFAAAHGVPHRPLSPEAITLLEAQPWPGNIRDLEYAMLRAVMLADGDRIGPEHLTEADGSRMARHKAPATAVGAPAGPLVNRTVADVERELILNTLAQCRGNRTTASMILGISVRTMRNKLKSFVEAGVPVAPAL